MPGQAGIQKSLLTSEERMQVLRFWMSLAQFFVQSATDSIKARDSEVTAGIFTVIIPATGHR